MKKTHILIAFIVLALTSCKRYDDDSSLFGISKNSIESKLKGSWTIEKIFKNGSEVTDSIWFYSPYSILVLTGNDEVYSSKSRKILYFDKLTTQFLYPKVIYSNSTSTNSIDNSYTNNNFFIYILDKNKCDSISDGFDVVYKDSKSYKINFIKNNKIKLTNYDNLIQEIFLNKEK